MLNCSVYLVLYSGTVNYTNVLTYVYEYIGRVVFIRCVGILYVFGNFMHVHHCPFYLAT